MRRSVNPLESERGEDRSSAGFEPHDAGAGAALRPDHLVADGKRLKAKVDGVAAGSTDDGAAHLGHGGVDLQRAHTGEGHVAGYRAAAAEFERAAIAGFQQAAAERHNSAGIAGRTVQRQRPAGVDRDGAGVGRSPGAGRRQGSIDNHPGAVRYAPGRAPAERARQCPGCADDVEDLEALVLLGRADCTEIEGATAGAAELQDVVAGALYEAANGIARPKREGINPGIEVDRRLVRTPESNTLTAEPTATMTAEPEIVPVLVMPPEKVELFLTKIPVSFESIVPPLLMPPEKLELL